MTRVLKDGQYIPSLWTMARAKLRGRTLPAYAVGNQ